MVVMFFFVDFIAAIAKVMNRFSKKSDSCQGRVLEDTSVSLSMIGGSIPVYWYELEFKLDRKASSRLLQSYLFECMVNLLLVTEFKRLWSVEPLPTMTKIIKEMLSPDVHVARDTQDLLIECCVEFINLVSSKSNEVCGIEDRRTIAPGHGANNWSGRGCQIGVHKSMGDGKILPKYGNVFASATQRTQTWNGIQQDITTRVERKLAYNVIARVRILLQN
ncbi:hypothetical protein M8C21_009423 [Ambrosia artemisiifolia]|uniref:Transcription factor CBF/NF-Y/archaeal histone domain-containing protein n=1 Tax=Ambrosia artemisiifolia TaxID=4212 RepID=A0AAD5GFC7_AMBAR|nr:hypothetical protein M8C21_009423 [Ambrosia artemisiifolia]